MSRMDVTGGADRVDTGSVPMARTFVCASGDTSAAEPSERPFALREMPRAPGGDRLEPRRHAKTLERPDLRWRARDAGDRASAEMGCSPSLPLHVASELIGISLRICSPLLLLLSKRYRTGICHSSKCARCDGNGCFLADPQNRRRCIRHRHPSSSTDYSVASAPSVQ